MVVAAVAWHGGGGALRRTAPYGTRRARVFGRRESRWLLAGRGAFGSASMALYYASVMLLPMADATTLFFTNP